jgi:hypothetical protein
MKPLLTLLAFVPLFTTGCIVYDSKTPSNLERDTAEENIRETSEENTRETGTNLTTETANDALAWLTPDSAVIGSVEIYSLQGDFDYSSVESLSLDGPSNADVVTMTPREDEILVVIGLDGKDVALGENDMTINFVDGSAFIVPSVLTVVAPK